MKVKRKCNHLKMVDVKQPPYPNAADNLYFKQKALDIITAIVSGFGLFSAVIFLVTMI